MSRSFCNLVEIIGNNLSNRVVHLDFESTSADYRGELLVRENVRIKPFDLSQTELDFVIAFLRARFPEVKFVLDRPADSACQTVYFGYAEAFAGLLGVAEAFGYGNAFVTPENPTPLDIAAIAEHELEHILYAMRHDGEGIYAYAADYNNVIVPGSLFSGGLTLGSSDKGTTIRVANGGLLYVSGGLLRSVIISSGGNAWVSSGGVLSVVSTVSRNLVSGGTLTIGNGGSSYYVDVVSNGYVSVTESGIATNNIISSRGSLFVMTGGLAKNNTILVGGVMQVNGADAVASGNTLTGGDLNVFNGGTALATVASGVAMLSTYSGGVFQDNTINSGAMLYVGNSGTASANVINNGGGLYVQSGGTAQNNSVNSGAVFYVSSGGYASGNKVYDGQMRVSSAGSADDNTVYSGSFFVFRNGVASNNIFSGGSIVISSGGKIVDTDIYGGSIIVRSGIVSNVTVHSGALISASAGATFVGDVFIGGSINLIGTKVISAANMILDVSERTTTDGYIIANLANFAGAASYGVNMNSVQTGTYSLAQGAASYSTSSFSLFINGIDTGKSITVNGGGTTHGRGVYEVVLDAANNLTLNVVLMEDPSLTVTTTLNVIDPTDNLISLREAMEVYASGLASDGRAAIDFASGLSGSFNAGTLSYSNTTITGNGVADTVITGGQLLVDSGYTLGLSAMTFSGNTASDGGAVNNGGTANLSNVNFTSNSATDGGAIFNDDGIVTITSGSFTGNSAGNYGGAVYNNGSATLTDVIFSGNLAGSNGGAVFNDAGGDITLSNASFLTKTDTIHNVGGVMLLRGDITLHATLTTSQAIDASGATITLALDNRTTTDGVLLNNYSLIFGTPDYFVSVAADQAEGTYLLADNAALFIGGISLIIDAVDTNINLVVGTAKTYGDMGYMLALNSGTLSLLIKEKEDPSLTVTTTSNVINPIDDEISLREAMEVYASGLASDGKAAIDFASGLSGSFNAGTLSYSNTTITGNGVADTVITGGQLSVDSDYTLGLSAMTFSGNTASDGGAVNNDGTANLSNVNFTSNTASNGGAVNNGGTATILGGAFTGNKATGLGGAIKNSGLVTISNVIFSANSANFGGAIDNIGSVILIGGIVSGNSTWGGGAILNSNIGSLSISGGTFAGNLARGGAAVHNSGFTTISGGTFTSNSATAGGAILNNSGSVIISNVTLNDNLASSSGGAIFNDTFATLSVFGGTFANNSANDGGAIYNNSGTATLSNVVFSGNLASNAGGAIYNTVGGKITLSNASFLTKTDAVYNAGTMSLRGNITLHATLTTNQVIDATGATITLALDNRASTDEALLNNYGSISGTPNYFVSVAADQAEGTYLLANNAMLFIGGVSLIVGSINTGINLFVGEGKRYNGMRYILAINSGTLSLLIKEKEDPSLTVTTTSNVINPTDDVISLREAMEVYASGLASNGTAAINFASGLSGSFNAGTLSYSNTTITGNGVADTVITGGQLSVDFGYTLGLSAMTFSGNTASNGGAIKNDGTANLNNVNFANNSAASNGGAIYNSRGIVIASGGTFSSNSAVFGGVIFNNDGLATVSGGIFVGNSATAGGVIYNSNGTATVSNGTFSSNSAIVGGAIFNFRTAQLFGGAFTSNSASSGGAVFNNGGLVTVSGGNFAGNSAASGGAIYNISGTVEVTNGTFSSNLAKSHGGAIHNYSGTATVISGTFTGNSAVYDGGAIYNSKGTATVTNGAFTSNSAAYDGGAIFNSSGTVTVTGGTFTGNSAGDNGGAIFNSNGTATVISGTFTGNSAENNGGAIFNSGGMATVTSGVFSGNSAVSRGGAIYNYFGTATFSGGTFYSNTVGNHGGAIYNDGTAIIREGTFTSNSAAYDGGAIYNYIDTVTISGGTFVGNSAGNGGAIHNYSGTVELSGATFSSNSAASGGAIYNISGTVEVSGGTFANNLAASRGGVIYNSGTVTVSGATFSSNLATSGGAIYNNKGTMSLNDLLLSGNSALAGAGGAIYNNGSITLSGVNLFGNSALVGGAIINDIDANSLVIMGGSFSGNSARFGGGIFNWKAMTLSGGEFINNFTNYSGGAIVNNGSAGLTDVNFTGNSAVSGGAIFNNGSMTIVGGVFTGNSAALGGAMYNTSNANATLSNAAFMTKLDTIYNAGAMTLRGTIILHATLTTTQAVNASGAAITLALDNRTTTDGALIEGYDFIGGAPSYSISVMATQALGTYKLATGVVDFAEKVNLTVEGISATNSLAVDKFFGYGGKFYLLSLKNSELLLTIGSGDYIVSATTGITYIGANAYYNFGNDGIFGRFVAGSGYNHRVFGGKDGENITGQVALNIESGAILSNYLFAGGHNGEVGNTMVNGLNGGTANNIVGGGLADVAVGSAFVRTAELNFSSGFTALKDNSFVFGGGVATGTGAKSEVDSVTIVIDGANLANIHGGGYSINGGRTTMDSATIIGLAGSVSGNIYGGGLASGYGPEYGSYAVVNNVVINISGGTYGFVLGGGYAIDSGVVLVSSVEITISGGRFEGTVYGGSHAHTVGDLAVVNTTSITIDVSSNVVDFRYGSGITVGGNQYSQVAEDTILTLIGQGSNLQTNGGTFDGWLNAGPASCGTNAAKTHTLRFADFTDSNFNARVQGFNSLELAGDTAITIMRGIGWGGGINYSFDLTGRNSGLVNTALMKQESGNLGITGDSDFFVDLSAADLDQFAGDSGSWSLLDGINGVSYDLSEVLVKLSFVTGGTTRVSYGYFNGTSLAMPDYDISFTYTASTGLFAMNWERVIGPEGI